MLNETYKIFKSGTDIRGIASEGVEGEHINLTDDIVSKIADGFVLWVQERSERARRICVFRSGATAVSPACASPIP